MLLAKGLWGFVDGTEELNEKANAQLKLIFEGGNKRHFLLSLCTYMCEGA